MKPAPQSSGTSVASPQPLRSLRPLLGLLLALFLVGLPRAALAQAPVISTNQGFEVFLQATNGTIVGDVLLNTNPGPAKPLSFWINDASPSIRNVFDLRSSTNNNDCAIQVIVTNGGNLTAVGTNYLQITVTNTSGQDSKAIPILVNLNLSPLSFTLAENATNGTTVGQIQSVSQYQSDLTFRAAPSADQSALNAFAVTPNGTITVKTNAVLDYETRAQYVLAIQVSNSAPVIGDLKITYWKVEIDLTNVNEAPEIKAKTLFLPPLDSSETLLGSIEASDPENDSLQFKLERLASQSGGADLVPGDYLRLQGREIRLVGSSSTALSFLADYVAYISVTETTTNHLSATNTFTFLPSPSFSQFGIPLLVPVQGHNGSPTNGLPIQAVAAGTNGAIYVVGVGPGQRGYLAIYTNGFYEGAVTNSLPTGFVPTAVAVSSTNLYIAGNFPATTIAAIYLYSAGRGTSLKTNNLIVGTTNLFNVTGLFVEGTNVFLCGGGGLNLAGMRPYWAQLNGLTLGFASNSPHLLSLNPEDIPGEHEKTVFWGIATAITKDPSANNVFVAGYRTYQRYWLDEDPMPDHKHYYYGISDFVQKFTNGSPAKAVLGSRERYHLELRGPKWLGSNWYFESEWSNKAGTCIKHLAATTDNYLYVLGEDTTDDTKNVFIRRYTFALDPPGSNPEYIITSVDADVRAESLSVANEEGTQYLYVTGIAPAGKETKFGTATCTTDSNQRYFVLKLASDFQAPAPWSTPLILSRGVYKPIGGLDLPDAYPKTGSTTLPSYYPEVGKTPVVPRVPSAEVVAYSSWGKDGFILAGNLDENSVLTLATESGSENSWVVPAGQNGGFLTVVRSDKVFEEPMLLEVVSEFGESGIHVRPYRGQQRAIENKTYTAEVLSPLYVDSDGNYLGSLDNPPSEQDIKERAVTRYVCTGYTVADTDIIGNNSSYTFQFTRNTKITFHWTVEHALEIRSDLTGTGALPDGNGGYIRNPTNFLGLTSLAAGNPSPEVKKHWVQEDELATPFIDGIVQDLSAFETRYVVIGYVATGYAVTNAEHPSTTNSFPAVQTRQQISQFPMRGPATITYLWGIQHRIQVSTSTLESQDWPGIKVVGDPSQPDRTGSGEFWFNRNTHLIIGGRETSRLQGALLATGDLPSNCLEKECFTNQFTLGPSDYLGAEVLSLSRGTMVSWNYGEVRIPQTVNIGDPVLLTPQTVTNSGLLAHVNTNKQPTIQALASPPGSTDADMCEWDQVARKSYPVRPGRFLLRYERDDSTNLAMTVDITSQLPAAAHYRHLVHTAMPPVHLDTDASDDIFFLKLAFTTNASVNGSDFIATNRDTSVLVFSRSGSNAVPYRAATGDRLKETLFVRVVATTNWDAQPGGFNPTNPPAPTPTWIGTRVSSTNDTAGIGTGFIAYTNARYNAAFYDRSRTADAGPIIPVNQHFRTNDVTHKWDVTHDLVIIWYERRDAILWPYTTERFDPRWPVAVDPARLPDPLPDVETMSAGGTNYLRRIVIASRLGSEGKDHALRDQLSFALPRYEQVTVYNQPNTNRPGFNPNEEHALVAPSFKFLDQANAPSAAYALRNTYNRTNHDATYTSEPYVLVQYLDHGTNLDAGEFKMAVYAVEKEDDRWQLNPQRYTNAVSGAVREFPYTFHYPMKAGEPVTPPYPLNLVIGLALCANTHGSNITAQRVYWEDYRGQPWAVSAGDFYGYFYYPLPTEFWVTNATSEPPGTCIAFETAGEVFVTGTNQNPLFTRDQKFTLNDTTATINGTTAAAFCAAVADAFRSNRNVVASVLASGEIRLRALNTNRLVLKEKSGTPLAEAGLPASTILPTPAVRYTATWPDAVPILKAGETLTFAGGEYKADNPSADGLPGVVGWAAGEVIYDSLNPAMSNTVAFTNYTARLISPLEERSVTLGSSDANALVEKIQPATGVSRANGTRWQFTKLPASLGKRISYDPVNRRLALKGFLNDKTLGDPSLTATPPPLYVLEPNILTRAESNTLYQLVALIPWQKAVTNLYALSRNPAGLINPASSSAAPGYFVGLDQDIKRDEFGTPILDASGNMTFLGTNTAAPLRGLGPGLALVPSPQFLDTNVAGDSYLTLAENNNADIGGPLTLHIVKVSKDYRYRGAIKTILSDNAFAEQVTLRHSGDFGANADDLVYQWFYREEDGTEAPVPPGGPWQMFPDQSDNAIRGLGVYQINLEGSGGLLLADNLFFVRYRHKNDTPAAGANSTDWTGTEWDTAGRFQTTNNQVVKVGTQWAGAANSPTVDGEYQPQLVMGWIKRVLDRINPYEARVSDFRNSTAPATYASMIQELGQHYEGPVALNPDKNVIENVGLIELYETVLNRGMDLSINLSSPLSTPGINTALQLAATRLSDFYMLLGNEAYADAQAPTIAYGDAQMDFASDYGDIASSMFSFQNQAGSLLDEELALLRGVPQSYGRPVYNRLFWNFTKSLGEVAYAVNYNITDYNRDGFINESDAMALYPQGHGDAWGHYLTAIKSHYRLLQHPYYNWVSRAEQYNLLDVVINVDYLDERRFVEAAAARAKAGAEIVNLTYRARYVEDPDGQWQGYTDLDTDRAWGVDGWARRAGQGALFDWMTANALIPSQDTNLQHNALEKIDRSTVTAIQSLSAQLGEIQSQYDNANNGLNPLGLAADVVPFDIDAATPGTGHFPQIYARAVTAVNNARTAFGSASIMQGQQRQVVESADTFRQEVIEQDLDFRNRLIEIFGTPYEGQIGAGKTYPAGYYGPDLMLFMYVAVNDVNSDTVPPSFTNVTGWVAGFAQQITNANPGTGVNDFKTLYSKYFAGDLSGVTNVNLLDFGATNILALTNLPVAASGYTYQAPADWGRRASPGELQLTICEMVQAEADLELAIGDYFAQVQRIQDLVDLLQAKHKIAAKTIQLKTSLKTDIVDMNTEMQTLRTVAAVFTEAVNWKRDLQDATGAVMDSIFGFAWTPLKIPKSAIQITTLGISKILRVLAYAADQAADIIEVEKEGVQLQNDIDITVQGFTYEIQEQLKDLEQNLRNERLLRVEAFKRVEALRQVSDRYRQTLEGGRRLLDERQVFNIKVAGETQKARYQDMAFRVFRNDALQKYRAAYDLAARYTYMAAKAFDYETNLSPDDRGSAQPVLTDIVRARTLGLFQDGQPVVGGDGLANALAVLSENYSVLSTRMSFNNPQYERELISLRHELFRISGATTNDTRWRETLKQYYVSDLWQVPEFRRYCRPPAPRSAGAMPGLVIPFGTEIIFGRNVFGWPLGPGDHAYDPSVFATKVQSAAVYFTNYQTVYLAATPRVYLVPAGLDVMTIPTSAELATREWTIVDQAIPVPYQTGTNDLADPVWIPVFDGLPEPFGQIRRFSSFLAKDVTEFDPGADALSYDTRLIGRSVWNTRWLLIIPGGHLLADGNEGLDTFIEGATVPGNPTERDGNGIKDIQLLFHTYGYSGN